MIEHIYQQTVVLLSGFLSRRKTITILWLDIPDLCSRGNC